MTTPSARVWLLLAVGLVLGGCSTLAPDRTDDASTSPTEQPSTTAAPGSPASYERAACDEVDGATGLICEIDALVRSRYVDDVGTERLATAAAAAVPPETSGGAFTCAIPDDAYLEVCEALAAAGGADEETFRTVAEGVTAAVLDPNSAYLDPQARQRAAEQIGGSIEGIGALVTTEDRAAADPASTRCETLSDDCAMVVVGVFENAPAEEAGLQVGDRIVAVEGQQVAGLTLDEVVDMVRGPAGTSVDLTIERDGERIELTSERAEVEIPVIETERVDDRTAYLKLSLFTEDSDERLEEALRQLLSQPTDTLVLDLRADPGGNLDAAINIASEFLGEGLVVTTEGPDEERRYEVEPGGIATDPDLAVVVLVDRGSASASEVLAGALQDADRAVIVGEPTYGKNTVQRTFPLDDGGALKLTIARWRTPAGRDFGGTGIAPDVRLELPADLTAQQATRRALEAVAEAAARG